MPNGWAEFLEKVQREAESGQADLHALWSEFLQRSQTSPRSKTLQLLAQAVQPSPLDQRVFVAFLMATLLDPLEWPPEWEQHRPQLIEGLEALLLAMDPKDPGSLAGLLELRLKEGALHSSGIIMVGSVLELLRTPCRQDQLRTVAQLCRVGLHHLMGAYRRALAIPAGQAQREPLLEARMRFTAAFDRYAQAARALNSATGEVLFQGLDERLETSET